MSIRAALFSVAVFLLIAPGTGIAQGERYPSKPIRFVLPFPAGGATDLVGRTVAEKLQEGLRHPVVLDFRPGAGGNLGTSIVAKSAPDGYTLLLCSPTLAISPSIYRNPGYDPLRDLVPISLAATIPTLVVVHPSVPVRTVRDLVQLARNNPGKLNFGSGGVGSSNHLAGELFKSLARVNVVHVPYKGTSMAMFALITGETDMVTISPPAALPLLREGKLRAIAVLRKERIAALPEVPTSAESGLPGWEVNTWYGVLTVAGTPREIVTQLNTEIVKGLATPDARKRLAVAGAEPRPSTPAEFAGFLRSEMERLGRIVRDAGIRVE